MTFSMKRYVSMIHLTLYDLWKSHQNIPSKAQVLQYKYY